jgi:ribosomal protein S18 acetylase RimI-like enzyme
MVPGPVDAAILRATRLAALSDTPTAFGSTYARESALSTAQWIEKAHQWTSPGAANTFLAFEGQACVGIVASFQQRGFPQQFVIVSMWVAPHCRRQGLAHCLLREVEMWAISQGAAELVLDVTETNHAAIACYRRYGFEPTGETIPYPNAPNLLEWRMRKLCPAQNSPACPAGVAPRA